MIIKKRALTNDPEHHIKGFGEAVTLTDKVSVAERYLRGGGGGGSALIFVRTQF